MELKYNRSRYFDVPKLSYFEMGNNTTGSVNSFNYRIDLKEEALRVKVWYGELCSELSEPEALEDFPRDDDGYGKMVFWLDEQFEEYKNKLASGETAGRRTFTGSL